MVKKLLATLVAIILTISQLSCMAASADSFGDIGESSQKGAIEVLHSLGLVNGDENGNFNPEREISRVEFLAMVIRMMGQEASAQALAGSDLPFVDVPSDHWGRGYIYFAYKMGIANGISATEFAPNNKVTYNQALKMVVSALGYGVAAERKGGWPAGYLAEAIELDLNDGVKPNEHNLKREETARIILNGLTVPMLELMNDEYSETSTPLEIMGYKKFNGVVTSTYEAQTTQNELDENKVEISGVLYKTSYFANVDLLGARVTYYTEDVDGEDIVRYIYRRYDGKVLDVVADDILDSTTLTEFVYNENNKTKRASLSGSALKIVYNGKVVGSSYYDGGKILQPVNGGSVSLRDSDGNGVYDIAIVNDLQTIVVNAVTEKDIFDKYGNSISLNMEEEQISVYKNGSRVDLSVIENGDILSVGLSKDKEKILIYVVDEKVTGTVSTSRQDGAKVVYEIETADGVKEFTIAKQFLDAQEKNLAAAKEFTLGDSGVFYLNYNNEIAYCELTRFSTDLSYGYVLDSDTSALSRGASFKILTADNKIKVFDAEDKIYFGRMSGGKYVRSREDSNSVATYFKGDVEFAMQICSYQLNDEGKITELQLADTKKNANDHLSCFADAETMYYSQKLINQRYVVDERTTVFYVPSLGEYEDVLAAGKYNKFLRQGSSIMALYDVENGHVGAVVLTPLTIQRYDNGAGEYETIIDTVNSPVLYIQSVSYAPGEDGNYYMSLTGIEDGEIVSVKVADVLSGSSEDKSLLKPGVAIQYEKNDLTRSRALTSDDESLLIVFKTVYDFNKEQPMMQTYNYMTSYQNRPKISVIHSRITTADPAFITVELDDKSSPTSGGTVYMSYDSESKNKFELINAAQISVGQEVMIRLRYLNTREVVVIER